MHMWLVCNTYIALISQIIELKGWVITEHSILYNNI